MDLSNLNLNDISFLQTAGYSGLFAMVFAETGLLIGLFLPGESLVFAAGLLCYLGYLNIWLVMGVTAVAAVLADNVGYTLGKKYGRQLFNRRESLLFSSRYIDRTEKFYQRHGGKTLIVARFIPFARTLAPIFAGVGYMPYRIFLIYNFVGGLLWTVVITTLGYFLGKVVPNATEVIIPIILLIASLTAGPALMTFIWDHRPKRT